MNPAAKRCMVLPLLLLSVLLPLGSEPSSASLRAIAFNEPLSNRGDTPRRVLALHEDLTSKFVNVSLLSGVSVAEGIRESLRVAYQARADRPAAALYFPETRIMQVDPYATRDTLAHEMGHVFVDAIKPGLRRGVGRVIHEAIADMVAVITAIEELYDPDRTSRRRAINLRTAHEINEIDLGFHSRSTLYARDLADIGFDPDRIHLPEIQVPNTVSDPHYTAQVLSGALYDILCVEYRHQTAIGLQDSPALVQSAREIGTLMIRALHFVGEHRVSLRDYGMALLKADACFLNGRLARTIAPILYERGILPTHRDCLDGAAPLPAYTLPPSGTEPAKLLSEIEGMELMLLDKVKAVPLERVLDRYRIPLLFHRHGYPFTRVIDPNTVILDADYHTPEGFRVIRLKYTCPADPDLIRRYELALGEGQGELQLPQNGQEAYASIVLDPGSNVIDIHSDRPLPRGVVGY